VEDLYKELESELNTLSLSDEERARVLGIAQRANKQYAKVDFLLKRVNNDKTITINLLNKTVEELQMRNDYIAETNYQLSDQKTKLEEQSKEMQKSMKALEMSYTEMEQFAYIASHDLKTPLRNIGSYAQLLKKRYYNNLDNTSNEFLDFIVSGVSQMNSIISDLLEYSRADREKEASIVDFARVVELVQLNVRDQIEFNKAIITTDNLPSIFASKSGIIQLFQNLIENAIKYRSDEDPVIHIKAELQESEWLFSVQDNGVGLEEIFQDKAFLPFQRIEHRDRPGSGMGLAICRKVVKMHDGKIWFSSNGKSGTCFHFTIPMIK
jgi:two-component system, chemotaxis family, sensor kinase Cph1